MQAECVEGVVVCIFRGLPGAAVESSFVVHDAVSTDT
jgi:hypothetical protein